MTFLDDVLTSCKAAKKVKQKYGDEPLTTILEVKHKDEGRDAISLPMEEDAALEFTAFVVAKGVMGGWLESVVLHIDQWATGDPELIETDAMTLSSAFKAGKDVREQISTFAANENDVIKVLQVYRNTATGWEWDEPIVQVLHGEGYGSVLAQQDPDHVHTVSDTALAVGPGGHYCTQCFGAMYSTEELRERYDVLGFSAGMCVVQDKKTGEKGSFKFAHAPRWYFDYVAHEEE